MRWLSRREVLERVPDSIRLRLDDWRTWMILAYFALAWVVTWLSGIGGAQAQEKVIRKATQDQAEKTCIAAAPVLKKFNVFFQGEKDLATEVTALTATLAQNSLAIVSATPKSDPQYAVRQANLQRLLNARDKLLKAKEKVSGVDPLPIPNALGCYLQAHPEER